MELRNVTVVLGSQWGDEGKGKIVDMLSDQANIVTRCQGGNNAGHTVVVKDTTYDFHLLPSGVVYEDCKCIIGNGVVVHIPSLFEEIEKNQNKGLKGIESRLFISDRAHVVTDAHRIADGFYEAERQGNQLGTTKKGIGPTYASKMLRFGLRFSDLGDEKNLQEKVFRAVNDINSRFPNRGIDAEKEFKVIKGYTERLQPMITDTVLMLHQSIQQGEKILVEGANAAMLDIDFGTYPFVTSSNCTVGGVCTGLGIPPTKIDEVIGVVKAYTTRVGAGLFPTELTNDIGQSLGDIGHEYGVTTGRRRRCGWLDLMVLKYSNMINGFTRLAVTKLDVLDTFTELRICIGYKNRTTGEALDNFPADHSILENVEPVYLDLKGWKCSTCNCRKFEDLPEQAQLYIKTIEQHVGVKVNWIGVGQSRDACVIIQ